MVDALASGASVPRDVEVRVFSRVPNKIATFGSLFYLLNFILSANARLMTVARVIMYIPMITLYDQK